MNIRKFQRFNARTFQLPGCIDGKPEFQRQGLGKELLSTLNDYCRKNGIKEIFVDASEEDPHAVDFYRSSGGIGEKVVQFTYTVND